MTSDPVCHIEGDPTWKIRETVYPNLDTLRVIHNCESVVLSLNGRNVLDVSRSFSKITKYEGQVKIFPPKYALVCYFFRINAKLQGRKHIYR